MFPPLNCLLRESARRHLESPALQTYGMYVADGGNIALTAESDLFTTHKWEEVGFDAYSLEDLRATDFDVIDHGPAITWTTDCVREQITQ